MFTSQTHLKDDLRTIFTLSLPVILETILQTLLGTTDTYFAGQLHDNAIAAIGVTGLFVNLLITVFTAISTGVTALVARSIGRRDDARANLVMRQALLLGGGIGLLLGVLSLLFRRPILLLTGAEDAVLTYALPYFSLVVGPCALICLTQLLSSCLRAAKDTLSPMLASGFANVLNIILNALFIRLGWGITGLALATTLSRAVTVLLLLFRIQKGSSPLRLTGGRWLPEGKTLVSILRIGIPAGIEKLVFRAGQVVYNNVILSLGTTAYVAHSVAGTIEGYFYIPAMGFAVAAATMVGVKLGEENPEEARRLTYLTDAIATAAMLLIAALAYILAPQLTALFTETAEAQALAVRLLRWIAFFQPFAALTQIITAALQGASDTRFPMYATFGGIWLLHVGIGCFLAVPMGWGLFGIWCGYVLDIVVRGMLLLVRFMRGKWQQITL